MIIKRLHTWAVNLKVITLLALTALLLPTFSYAEVTLTDAWVRASTPGQTVAAAYLTMQSAQPVTLVYVETERAGSVEMHSMTVTNGVMKMRRMDNLALPAGKPVKLAPGGLHFMLFEFATPFKAGEAVKFRLCFKDQQGQIQEQYITMPVKSAP